MKTCPACSAENNADSKFCSAEGFRTVRLLDGLKDSPQQIEILDLLDYGNCSETFKASSTCRISVGES